LAGPVEFSFNAEEAFSIIYFVVLIAILASLARMPNKKSYYLPFVLYAAVAAAYAVDGIFVNAASTAAQAYSRTWPLQFGISYYLLFPLAYHFVVNFTTTRKSLFQKVTLVAGYAYMIVVGPLGYSLDPSLFGTSLGHMTAFGYTIGPLGYTGTWLNEVLKTPPLPTVTGPFFFLSGHTFTYAYLVLTFLPLYYLFRYSRSAKSPLIKSQVRYLSAGVLLDWLAYVEGGFAIYGPLKSLPQLTYLFQTFTVIILFVGLTRHQFRKVTPTLEAAAPLPRTYQLEDGRTYLARENKQSFDAFAELVRSGREGLCVTRIFPDDVRKTYGLETTPIRWLADEKREDAISPTDLLGLSLTIKDFVNMARKPVVILQGVEHLAMTNGFTPIHHLINGLYEAVGQKGGILLLPVTQNALDPREDALLVAETTPQPPPIPIAK